MKAEVLEKLAHEMIEFERLNFGLKFGSDFAELAKELIATKHFATKEFLALTLTILTGGSILDQVSNSVGMIKPESFKDIIGDKMRGTPLEAILLEMFYWGYQAGKQNKECETLENLVKQK